MSNPHKITLDGLGECDVTLANSEFYPGSTNYRSVTWLADSINSVVKRIDETSPRHLEMLVAPKWDNTLKFFGVVYKAFRFKIRQYVHDEQGEAYLVIYEGQVEGQGYSSYLTDAAKRQMASRYEAQIVAHYKAHRETLRQICRENYIAGRKKELREKIASLQAELEKVEAIR